MKVVHAVFAVAVLGLGTANAAVRDEAGRSWELELGKDVFHRPNYSGTSASSPWLYVWSSGEYRIERKGTFTLDAGSLTLDPHLRRTVATTTVATTRATASACCLATASAVATAPLG